MSPGIAIAQCRVRSLARSAVVSKRRLGMCVHGGVKDSQLPNCFTGDIMYKYMSAKYARAGAKCAETMPCDHVARKIVNAGPILNGRCVL